MRIAYFDCFSGISGDMTVGALLDLGVSLEHLKSELEKLRLPGWDVFLGRRVRAGISAADFDVRAEDDAPERGFTQIKEIIERSDLSPWVKERAIAVFRRLGEAESKVHDTTIDKIHFHEVGAIDCIIDICGACIGLEALKIEKIVASPLPQGYGFVRCAHGRMPVPTPATLEILRDCPTYSVDIEGELVTPTGAAILSTLAADWGRMPPLKPESIGYGSGKKDFGPRPNLLRVVVGEAATIDGSEAVPSPPRSPASAPPQEVAVLEANIDDMNPEGYDWVSQLLFRAGALDVTLTPIQMKKGRPGVTLSVIAPVDLQESLANLLFRETTTFGVRTSRWLRYTLNREFVAVRTPYGEVKVKIGRKDSEICTASPEYEDCRIAAEQAQVPLKAVYRAALVAFERERSAASRQDD
jgi:uncharacterized protein (TIGR00299 family) protein